MNFLGIALSLVLVAGEVFIFAFDGTSSSIFNRLAANVAAAVYLYFECMLIGTIVADVFAARYEPELNVDFLIILGCGIREDGSLTPLLQQRVERALAFYNKQKKQTGKDLTFIPSGGQGADEAIAESTAMKRYLLQRGIAQRFIIEENASSNTFENMRFSKALIDTILPEGKVAFCTTNYHVFRSGLMARRVKMRAVGMGAKTKWFFWPNAAVREFAGLLVNHRMKQTLILSGMILIFIILTFIS